ncbi:hypothetical protein MNV49_005487 [Pseudohyphozyma bogoriensis]|nr:hypothetical protein MNV49_005487 [Pseudohyphozyma bogoriensis]
MNEGVMFRFQMAFILEGVQTRLYRLHRSFAPMGYKDKKYSLSTVMGASLVLFADIYEAINSDSPPSLIDSKRAPLLLATELFSSALRISSPALQAAVQQGHKILQGLFATEEARLAARRSSPTNTNGNGSAGAGVRPRTSSARNEGKDAPESFSDVLKRISNDVNTSLTSNDTSTLHGPGELLWLQAVALAKNGASAQPGFGGVSAAGGTMEANALQAADASNLFMEFFPDFRGGSGGLGADQSWFEGGGNGGLGGLDDGGLFGGVGLDLQDAGGGTFKWPMVEEQGLVGADW